jgi:hypothetical protein
MEECSTEGKDGESVLQEQRRTVTSLVSFNFKVPLRVRQQFKMLAARHNMTMTEILLRLLNQALLEEGSDSTKRE